MSWQRSSETLLTTEWTTFTKEHGKNQTALLEEVTKNPSFPVNWRLSLQEPSGKEVTDPKTGKKTAVLNTIEQWTFKILDPKLGVVFKKAEDLLEAYGKEPEAPKVEEPSLPSNYGEGPGEWVWKDSRPEWVPAGAKKIVVKEAVKVKSKPDPRPASFVDPGLDVGALRQRQLETQRVTQRA